MNIFLDDFRMPSHSHFRDIVPQYNDDSQWAIVRSFKQFALLLNLLAENLQVIKKVSFDHDLDEEHYDMTLDQWESYYDNPVDVETGTGLHAMNLMFEIFESHGVELPEILIHTANPWANKRMKEVLDERR